MKCKLPVWLSSPSLTYYHHELHHLVGLITVGQAITEAGGGCPAADLEGEQHPGEGQVGEQERQLHP